MELKPLFGRVLLDRPRKEKVGSIILPETVQKANASLKCRVLATGPTADPSIAPGMWVLIGRNAGTWLDKDGNPVPQSAGTDGVTYFMVQDEDILAEVAGD